jgi:hypothetical protein
VGPVASLVLLDAALRVFALFYFGFVLGFLSTLLLLFTAAALLTLLAGSLLAGAALLLLLALLPGIALLVLLPVLLVGLLSSLLAFLLLVHTGISNGWGTAEAAPCRRDCLRRSNTLVREAPIPSQRIVYI